MSPTVVALEELLLDVRIAGHGQERREPVVVADDLVREPSPA